MTATAAWPIQSIISNVVDFRNFFVNCNFNWVWRELLYIGLLFVVIHIWMLVGMMLPLLCFNNFLPSHPWCDSHFTNISAYGVWKTKAEI